MAGAHQHIGSLGNKNVNIKKLIENHDVKKFIFIEKNNNYICNINMQLNKYNILCDKRYFTRFLLMHLTVKT